MPELRILFLDGNMISSIEGLSFCTQLDTLQISSNNLLKLENLPPTLSTLNAAGGLRTSAGVLSCHCPATVL